MLILFYKKKLTDFPALKGFWKLVTIWRNYRHKSVASVFGTQCILYD